MNDIARHCATCAIFSHMKLLKEIRQNETKDFKLFIYE